MKNMYFKVYQDKDSCGDGWTYYVATYDEIIETSLDEWMLSHLEDDEPMPVIEPVMITEEEFEKLPGFDGF